jgi:hypothetical protein
MAEQVPGRVDLDLEPRLRQPAARKVVRLVLLGRPGDAVRAGPVADRVELVQPVGNARAYSPKGLSGFEPVFTITLFVSR